MGGGKQGCNEGQALGLLQEKSSSNPEQDKKNQKLSGLMDFGTALRFKWTSVVCMLCFHLEDKAEWNLNTNAET